MHTNLSPASRFRWRPIVVVAAVMAGSLVIAGCSSAGSDDDARVVRVLAVDGPETDALIAGAAAFEEATGITASIEQVARTVWGQRKVAELIEGAGMYDVVFIGAGDDAMWALEKADVLDLSEYLTDDVASEILHGDLFTNDDGDLIAVPQYYNFPMFFYRQDLFDDPDERDAFSAEYGRDLAPPTTYEEMFDLAEFFHRPPETYGYCLGGVDWSVFLDDTYFVYGLGANYGDLETGELTLDTPEQIEAMEWIDRFTDFNAPGWETQSFFDCDQLMQEGKVAMYQNWLYAWEVLKESMGDDIGMAAPVGELTHLGAMAATIPASAEHPDEAGEFIAWMLSDEYQQSQVEATGNLPVLESQLSNESIRAALDGIEVYEPVVQRLTYNFTTWSGELSTGVAEAIAKVYSGEMTAAEAAEWLQNEKFAGRAAIE